MTTRRACTTSLALGLLVLAACAAPASDPAAPASTTARPVTSSSPSDPASGVPGSSAPIPPGSAPTTGTAGAAGPASGELVAAACAGTLVRSRLGTVASPELNEVSGIAASTTHPGVLWVHNDSGDSARVFALSSQGTVLGTFGLAGAEAQDWEDIAIGPGPVAGTRYLYLGDIGDNAEARRSITIYRVAEPAVDPDAAPLGRVELTGVDALRFTYPDGAHNAEALLVDTDGSIAVLTKAAGTSTIFRAPPGAPPGSTTPLRDEGTVALDGGELVTGADLAPAGDAVALRTYRRVLLFPRSPGRSLAATLAASPCPGAVADEPQGEAISFTADGLGYVTTSEGEGQPITQFRAP